jgi:hypothetical protein
LSASAFAFSTWSCSFCRSMKPFSMSLT